MCKYKKNYIIHFTFENAGWREEYILILQTDIFLFVKGDYGIGLLFI